MGKILCATKKTGMKMVRSFFFFSPFFPLLILCCSHNGNLSTRGKSQIWLQVREHSRGQRRHFLEWYYVLATSKKRWQLPCDSPLVRIGGGGGTKMASKKNLAIVRKRMCHVDTKFTQVLLIFWANED
jgi:hypothetical protein